MSEQSPRYSLAQHMTKGLLSIGSGPVAKISHCSRYTLPSRLDGRQTSCLLPRSARDSGGRALLRQRVACQALSPLQSEGLAWADSAADCLCKALAATTLVMVRHSLLRFLNGLSVLPGAPPGLTSHVCASRLHINLHGAEPSQAWYISLCRYSTSFF